MCFITDAFKRIFGSSSSTTSSKPNTPPSGGTGNTGGGGGNTGTTPSNERASIQELFNAIQNWGKRTPQRFFHDVCVTIDWESNELIIEAVPVNEEMEEIEMEGPIR